MNRTVTIDDFLDEAVRETTGNPDAQARPSQRVISRRMWTVLSASRPRPTLADEERDDYPRAPQAAIEAPTGSGKGLAYLTPAVLANIRNGTRTVVSTESIALQTQLVQKDFPAVARAAARLFNVTPKVAVHKGWANYVCLVAALGDVSAKDVAAGSGDPAELAKRLETISGTYTFTDPLRAWALRQPVERGDGDRAGCPDTGAATRWEDVSVDPGACVGSDCPLYSLCFPAAAREEALAADVVVTNHSLIAVQAARSVPAVFGSRAIGDFDAFIADEAHTLPSQVRNMGSTVFSGRTILSVQRALESVLDPADPVVLRHRTMADELSKQVNVEVHQVLAGADKVVKVDHDVDPFKNTGTASEAWLASVSRAVGPDIATDHLPTVLRLRRFRSRVETAQTALRDVRNGALGVARWVEPAREPDRSAVLWPSVHASPVDVAPLLVGNVYTQQVAFSPSDRVPEVVPRYSIPVVACSATLPGTFPFDSGMWCRTEEFESPFADAYAKCLLYVPAPGDVPVSTFGGKPRMDTYKHPEWAVRHMEALVEANGGRALILSATAGAGRMYADRLRAHARGRWRVIDTWTTPRERAVTEWRSDVTSVLVGTRGLMTGVDASGDTNSLVILDRVPRAAGNPVDDARVEVATQVHGKWKADEVVYVSDAAALTEQAAGRLVRSASDAGMLAVLDPRLLRMSAPGVRSKIAYRESVRSTYMDAVSYFPSRVTSLDRAVTFLQALRASNLAA